MTINGHGIARRVRVRIPQALNQPIIMIQAREGLDYDDAALRLAAVAEPNGKLFEDAVAARARSLAKSIFLKQLNAARATIRREGFIEGVTEVRRIEDNFHAPCSKCGKPMSFSSRGPNWEKSSTVLHEAFKDWSHVNCPP